MPAATTHIEFAKDVYRSLSEDLKKKIANQQMFLLGSQGPDMLFFSKASVLPGSLHKYGNLMHNEKVPEVIAYFEHWISVDPDLTSYFMGYLCHYALDSTAHPLINAIAKARHEQAGVHEGAAHVTMEADIDVWILHQRGRKISSYDVNRIMKTADSDARKLAEMYSGMFAEVYGLTITAADLFRAIKEVSFYTGILYPRRITNLLISQAEKVLHMPAAISGMILVDKGNMQVINLDHTAYTLRFDESKQISASFPELYGQAALKAKRILCTRSDDDFALNFNGEPKQS